MSLLQSISGGQVFVVRKDDQTRVQAKLSLMTYVAENDLPIFRIWSVPVDFIDEDGFPTAAHELFIDCGHVCTDVLTVWKVSRWLRDAGFAVVVVERLIHADSDHG